VGLKRAEAQLAECRQAVREAEEVVEELRATRDRSTGRLREEAHWRMRNAERRLVLMLRDLEDLEEHVFRWALSQTLDAL
jgi:hypothetical protein